MYQRGDRVIYRAAKHSAHPGPRAERVQPEPNGEGYSYDVKKFWVVAQVLSDGTLVVLTRRGKKRLLQPTDPRLRAPRWWELLLFGARFPQLAPDGVGDQPASGGPSLSKAG